MTKRTMFYFVLVANLAWGWQPSATPTREQRELKMADDSIAASLAVLRSPKGRYLCAQTRTACLGADKAELGLALIGARSSSASLEALADIVRYRTDASLSEDYDCYVLQKGRLIDKSLAEVKPAVLEKRCNAELEKLIAVDREYFEGLKPDAVCADEQAIRAKINSLRESIRAGRKCAAEDF